MFFFGTVFKYNMLKNDIRALKENQAFSCPPVFEKHPLNASGLVCTSVSSQQFSSGNRSTLLLWNMYFNLVTNIGQSFRDLSHHFLCNLSYSWAFNWAFIFPEFDSLHVWLFMLIWDSMKVGISEFFFFSHTHLNYNLNSSLLEF